MLELRLFQELEGGRRRKKELEDILVYASSQVVIGS